jgi:hypothetical protein
MFDGFRSRWNDPLVVRGLQGVDHLTRDAKRLRHAKSAWLAVDDGLRDRSVKRLSFDQFEDEEVVTVGLFDAIDRGDVRMIERGEQPRLALKASETLRIGGE